MVPPALMPLQVPTPAPDQAPWPWLAALLAGAAGVVFWQLRDAWQGRAERAERLVDELVPAVRTQTETIKEQAGAVGALRDEVADLARAVEGGPPGRRR